MRDETALKDGTSCDLVAAATLGARIATRARVALGEDEATIRRQVVERFRDELAAESYGDFIDETLMAAVQRGVEAVLEELAADSPEPEAFGASFWRPECSEETWN